MLLNLNQDMVGARQSWGGRVQYASRLPWSLPHALDDVMESVLGLVSDGNTSYLTTRRPPAPVPSPARSPRSKGSRSPSTPGRFPTSTPPITTPSTPRR